MDFCVILRTKLSFDKKLNIRNALNNVKNIVFVLGIPLKAEIISSTKKLIREIFSEIEIKELNQNV